MERFLPDLCTNYWSWTVIMTVGVNACFYYSQSVEREIFCCMEILWDRVDDICYFVLPTCTMWTVWLETTSTKLKCSFVGGLFDIYPIFVHLILGIIFIDILSMSIFVILTYRLDKYIQLRHDNIWQWFCFGEWTRWTVIFTSWFYDLFFKIDQLPEIFLYFIQIMSAYR